MPEQNTLNDERVYQYASSYFYFRKALKILSLEATEQCGAMGHFNVAWELKDELLRSGIAVLNSLDGKFSSDESNQISELLEDLRKAPDEVVQVDNSREKHLESMNNPFWDPLRSQARKLIEALAHETERTNTILWPVAT